MAVRTVNKKRRRVFTRKGCKFCSKNAPDIDYKNVELLKKFVTERGKMVPSRITGNCAKHQRRMMRAIKRARIMGFLPFAAE